MLNTEYINPTVLVSPQAAFYAEKKCHADPGDGRKDLRRVVVMCYPPGIPILAPGEMITPENYRIYHLCQGEGLLHAGNGRSGGGALKCPG